MTLTMGLRYKNPDASADINLRLKDVANKGFVVGGRVTPVSGALQVTVEPFVCITYDGAVVRSDANVVLNPGDGTTPPTSVGVTVIALRARYVPLGSPVMVVQAMPVESYLIDPEINWLTVLAIVDLTSGAPHSEVPADAILTTWTNGTNTVERHAVDPQNRSSFRAPVVNSGDLLTPGSPYLPPLADNRNGDVVFATDTGTFYWWNGASWSWEIFDEVPLAMHREHEHTNGITGDSAPDSLFPSASGTSVTIGFVPPGSGYTVNGRYRTSPTVPVTRNLAAGGLFPSRGLIQASVDEDGVADVLSGGVGDYRVRKSSGDPVDIAAVRIIDISDKHTNGTFPLSFDAAAGLSWNLGEPVNVGVGTATGGRYRLFAPNYLDWIDVELTTGAVLPALASDSYDVLPSKKDDEHLLVAHFWWDGTTASVGADKRYFGNIGLQELSYDYKNTEAEPWVDLRGNSVYSGGDVSIMPSDPTKIRITGPIVVYLNRPQRPSSIRRIVPVTIGSENGYTGITPLAGGATGYVTIFVSTNGVLSKLSSPPTPPDSTGWPIIPEGSIRICDVKVDGGVVVLIVDARDPQLIVGQATRDSKLVFSRTGTTRWHDEDAKLYVENNGDTSGVQVRTGSFLAKDNQFISPSHVQLVTDPFSGTIPGAEITTPVTDAAHPNIRKYQPPFGRDPSIIGVIADGQEAQRYGLGCIGVNACPVTCASDGSSVTIGTGTFYDFQGRKVVISSPVVLDTSDLANGTYTIDWDGELTSGTAIGGGAFEVSEHGSISWRRSLAFAVFNKSGTSVVTNCQLYATGSMCQEEFSIGFDAGVVSTFGRGGNFSTLRKALVFRVCYSGGAGTDLFNAPRRFAVYDQINEGADLIDFNSFEFLGLADDHLDGLHVYGSSVTATTVNRGILRWGVEGTASAVPMIDFRNQINSVRFSDLRIEYNGATGVDNNNCWIRNPGQNLVVENCGFAPQGGVGEPLFCLVRYDVTASLGGTATSLVPGTLFKNCNFINITTGSETFALSTASLAGRIAFENCVFGGGEITINVVNILSATATCDVTFSNCDIRDFIKLVEAPAGMTGKLLATGCKLAAGGGSGIGPTASTLDLTDCTFVGSTNLEGVRAVHGCTDSTGITVTAGSSNELNGCTFNKGTFTGDVNRMSNCVVSLGSTGSLLVTDTTANCYITNSKITTTASNTIITIPGGIDISIFNSRFEYNGSPSASSLPLINVTGNSSVSISSCDIYATFRQPLVITFNSSSDLNFSNNYVNIGTTVSSVEVPVISVIDNSENVIISRNVIEVGSSAGTGDIGMVLLAPASGAVSNAVIENNKFNGTSSRIVRADNVRNLSIKGNKVSAQDGNTMMFIVGFGGESTLETYQDTFVFESNEMISSSAPYLELYTTKYNNISINNNTVINKKTNGQSGITFYFSAYEKSSININNNMLRCENNGYEATTYIMVVRGEDSVQDSVITTSINGNTVFASSADIAGQDNPIVKSSILIDGTEINTITGNILGTVCAGHFDVVEASGAFIKVTGPPSPVSQTTITGNVVDVDGPPSTARAQIISDSYFTIINGNIVTNSVTESTTADAAVSYSGNDYGVVTNNIITAVDASQGNFGSAGRLGGASSLNVTFSNIIVDTGGGD